MIPDHHDPRKVGELLLEDPARIAKAAPAIRIGRGPRENHRVRIGASTPFKAQLSNRAWARQIERRSRKEPTMPPTPSQPAKEAHHGRAHLESVPHRA